MIRGRFLWDNYYYISIGNFSRYKKQENQDLVASLSQKHATGTLTSWYAKSLETEKVYAPNAPSVSNLWVIFTSIPVLWWVFVVSVKIINTTICCNPSWELFHVMITNLIYINLLWSITCQWTFSTNFLTRKKTWNAWSKQCVIHLYITKKVSLFTIFYLKNWGHVTTFSTYISVMLDHYFLCWFLVVSNIGIIIYCTHKC